GLRTTYAPWPPPLRRRRRSAGATEVPTRSDRRCASCRRLSQDRTVGQQTRGGARANDESAFVLLEHRGSGDFHAGRERIAVPDPGLPRLVGVGEEDAPRPLLGR